MSAGDNQEIIADEANRKAQDYSCPNCGAPVQYDPSKAVLHCEYCGYEGEITGVHSRIENDFNAGKIDDSEWNKEAKVVHCDNCGANNVVDSGEISIRCPFCGSNQVVDTDELAGIKPHRVIPFQISNQVAKEIYSKWLKKKFFVPSTVKKTILHLQLGGVYLPVWTFDTETSSNYDGQLGKHYTRTVGTGKNAHTVTEVRYFHIKGKKDVTFDDLIVNAGTKISQSEINAISPFDTNNAYVYDKRYLAGFASEHYVLRLENGWTNAKNRINTVVKNEILKGYSYDVVSYIHIQTLYHNIKYKYVLVPIWIGAFQFGQKSYRFIINGENGKITGKTPISVIKVSLLVLLILILLIGVFLFAITGDF